MRQSSITPWSYTALFMTLGFSPQSKIQMLLIFIVKSGQEFRGFVLPIFKQLTGV